MSRPTRTSKQTGARSAATIAALIAVLVLSGPAPADAVARETAAPEAAAAPAQWLMVDGGGQHTCGIKTTGRLYCWGYDDHGQLGDGGANADKATPVEVAGHATTWTTVSAGAAHTCARQTSGRLYCWGYDLDGELGDDEALTDRSVPTAVAGGATDWASLTTGYFHTCAQKTSGRLYCWGANATGQLGDASGADHRAVPTPVAGGATDWDSVATGYLHTCARKTSGRLYCWGYDGMGQLGDGGLNTDRATPTQVAGASTAWSDVAAGGFHTCGRRTSGRLYCWGYDDSGQLGDGNADAAQIAPTAVAGGATDWASVTAGDNHTCARRSSGQLSCWGYDGMGQLGDGGPDADQGAPVGVAGGATDWRSITTGANHSCAINTASELFCWGNDDHGELGDGRGTINHPTPTQVGARWRLVEAGDNHTCGVKTSGQLFCWGNDDHGQLGDDTAIANQPAPVEVSGGSTDWASVSAYSNTTCARKTSGRLYCWGSDALGQLGDDGAYADRPTPTEVAGGATDWAAVSTGFGHTCARKTTGHLYCWGEDNHGQLGVGENLATRPLPVEVFGGGANWAAVAAGQEHTCGLKTSGRLYCWGSDWSGALGNGGDNADRHVPEEVAGGATTWTTPTLGVYDACARRTTGRVYCWGYALYGQIGNGATTYQPTPAEVAGGATNWGAPRAGLFHTCAARTTGRLYCWGHSDAGQLGDGSSTDRSTPVEVVGGATDWTAVTGGDQHSCGIRAQRVYCWGADGYGQLGNGDPNTGHSTPVLVVG